MTLVFLSPFIAEVLYGSTHLTTLFLLLPQMAVYGCAALIIRDVVRRTGRGWPAILLLGVAYAIIEECVILQTSLAPLFFAADPFHVYGRALGVNWPYFIWALGYESVWSIVIPIQITEMIFPVRRNDPWLGRPGLVTASGVFIAGSIFVWFIWNQVAMKQFYHGPPFHTPLLAIAIAALVAAALSAFAFMVPPPSTQPPHIPTGELPPWLLLSYSFAWGLAWFVLVILASGYVPSIPPWFQIVLGVAITATALAVVQRLTTRFIWTDRHRLALITGALVASMSAGVLASGITLPIDMAAKLVFDAIAIVLLAMLFGRIRSRSRKENGKLPA